MDDQLLTIVNKDSVVALSELAPGSVHLIVTSPPYDALRTYRGESWDFTGTAVQMWRVLVKGGVLCWVVGEETIEGSESLTTAKQKIHFVEVCGFRIHDTMIYQKANFSHPEKVRYHQVFEYIFVLSKGAPRVFNPIKDKPNANAGRMGSLGTNTFTRPDGSKGLRERKLTADFGMRTNVWRGKTRGQEEMCQKLNHPAMMPRWLARDLILSWSNPGDLVADPFCGSGTTGSEAIATGRRAWLNDVNADYVKQAEESCSVRGLALQ
jgi:DNA modification methylase